MVALLKRRDVRAFDYLYDHYSAAMYGVILRIVQAEGMSEEVLQDVFLKIWNNFQDYNSEKGRLFTWMINIARNMAIDKLRSRDFKSNYKSEDIDGNVSIADEHNASKYQVEHIGIREVLNTLPPEQKEIIDLMYFQGYSQSEISEEFNIPLGTVKTRARSAIGKLKQFFITE